MAAGQRLVDIFQPTHYDIYLDINRATKVITGQTAIKGTAKQADILLNQKFMTVQQVKVDDQVVTPTVDDASETIAFTAPHTGEMTILVDYTAPLTDTMMGIYPSYYQVNGEKKQLIGTQFETTAARQAFPGIDEPAAKATFSLAIKYDEQDGETIIANMPEEKVVDGVHYFAETVKMSTYLVAFAFGEMQSKLTKTNSGVQVGVFATKAHQASELDFALDIAKRSIEFYEDYYQTPYPLPHSWQLGLPDFSAGAMENWGLVTYREAYLTLDEENASLEMKQRIATVIAHELAHQWFGDLVTMQWWDDLWLNESFANMMEYVAIDALEPDWHIWELFQTSEAAAALQRDATDGVQSVHVQVEKPAEIDAIFDSAIVYAKGSRMLVMVRALIGDDALRRGLKAYFEAHQYGNARGADLWAALGQAAGIDLTAMMDTWLEQPGYPVLTVAVVDGQLQVKQQQFFIGDGVDKGRQWQIPLNSNYTDVPELMVTDKLVLGDYKEMRQTAGTPFRLNVGNTAHFIVNYEPDLLQDILADIDNLDAITQLQLLQDLRLLAEGRQISYAVVVPLLQNFANSTSGVVNTALYQVANNLKKFVTDGTSAESQLKQLINKLSADQFTRLGWQGSANEPVADQVSRPVIVDAALYAQNEAATSSAHELVVANRDALVALPADVRADILANEVKHYGSRDLFDQLLSDYQTTADGGYQRDITVALTATQDVDLIKELISYFENSDIIKPQDLRGWYKGVLSNDKGQQLAWDWLRDEWSWLEKTVGGDMEFTTYITVTASVFKTAERLAEFKAFFEPKQDTPGLGREITMDTNVIAGRVALINDEQAAVHQAISEAL
ncbi:M1 family metallopeptidase [Weissella bombi]|uniref:Aminopeptidase n=1 Tax=Weissella bombi TaxID=1505725 RepID=A0A1C4BGM6_9LACO|nr:M1 family metallopeptidase [Weissella bombi]SCC05990.1 aminopeptidase N [Weissella bombi]